ncbi:hypothetical protein HNR21_001733 [Actinomadura cellulosilytica]|uniref:Uncharacterized protein n=2 Tax=Thermomonospora cellulosilytica TaxID=1411118 RepID=A0A7W3R7P7_9ACTN|nr:hypothetical protein [Thermomonospora cellulosilytica]
MGWLLGNSLRDTMASAMRSAVLESARPVLESALFAAGAAGIHRSWVKSLAPSVNSIAAQAVGLSSAQRIAAQATRTMGLASWQFGPSTWSAALIGTRGPSVTRLAEMYPALNSSILNLGDSIMKAAGGSINQMLRDLFSRWRHEVLHGVGLVRDVSRWAYQKALATRRAILQSLDEEPVADFIREVLDRRPNPELMEAVRSVLLEDDWIALGAQEPHLLVDDLKARLRVEYPRWKPESERQLNHMRVALLGEQVTVSGSELGTTADLLSCPRTPEDIVLDGQLTEQRLLFVLNSLTLQQRRIVNCYSEAGGQLTWAQAAVLQGLPESEGERTRRRVATLRMEWRRRQGLTRPSALATR